MSDDKDPRLSRSHIIHSARADQIRLNLQAVAGGRPYITARLSRLPFESDASWTGRNTSKGDHGRIDRAFLINYASRIGAKINQFVFLTEVRRANADPRFIADATRTGELLDEVKPRKIVRKVIEAAYTAGYECHSDGITLMPELADASLKMKHPAGVGHDWLYYMGLSNPFLPSWVKGARIRIRGGVSSGITKRRQRKTKRQCVSNTRISRRRRGRGKEDDAERRKSATRFTANADFVLLSLCHQSFLNLLEFLAFAFSCRPSFDLFEIDRITLGNGNSLIEALLVLIMIIPCESVFDAIGGGYDPEYSCGCSDFMDILDGLFADGGRALGIFDKQFGVRMFEIATFFGKTKAFHHFVNGAPFRRHKPRVYHVEIHREVLSMAVD
ncbi:MAG: hypothetical protein PHW60_14675 [Kiritimatiellae bacterium]|nr:hypothetical protein [Kiritimatiellia bacterium]